MTATAPPEGPADGRHARRERNRLAVVDAMLQLYTEGNLDPSSDQIAERAGLSPRSLFRYFEDLDDLVQVAISRQYERVRPLTELDLSTDGALAERVARLVRSRLRTYDEIASVGKVARMRAPFQPLLAEQLAHSRALWRRQTARLFVPELAAMTPSSSEAALAAAEVLVSFESVELLRDDQRLSRHRIEATLVAALTRLLDV